MKWIMGILLLLVACGPAMEAKSEAMQATEQAPKVSDEQMKIPSSDEVKEVIDQKKPAAEFDMSQAVMTGQPIKCTSSEAGQTATIYMKGGKMRMDTMPVDAHAIYTENTVYTWQGKMGTKVQLEDLKKMAEDMAKQYQPKSQDEVVANAQKSNAKCEPFDVSETTFSAPSDVEFQDITEMLKSLPKMPSMPTTG